MSSLNIKQGSDAHFPDYPLASPSNNEIDLLNLISVLWRAKKTVMAVVFHPAAKMDQRGGCHASRTCSVARVGEIIH